MNIENERKLFEEWNLKTYGTHAIFATDGNPIGHIENDRWQGWQASANREGFVLVPENQVTVFWQDDDDPENFVSKESDFDCLGDCIDIDDIMQINKHHQAHIQTEKLHGTWVAKDEGGGMLIKDSFYAGTEDECELIVAKNKTMIKASQENKDE